MSPPPGRDADSLLDVITRAWLRDPDPALDPVWFASVVSPRPDFPADPEGDAALSLRLRQRPGRHPLAGSAARAAWAPHLEGPGAIPGAEAVGSIVRLIADLFCRLAEARPAVAGALIAMPQLLAAHNYYMLAYAAARYRTPLLRGRVGGRPAAARLGWELHCCVRDIEFARAISAAYDWRPRLPPDGAVARVGGEFGPSHSDAVFRVGDRTLGHVRAMTRADLLTPVRPRRPRPTAGQLLDHWCRQAAPLRPLLPDARQAKKALAELQRRFGGPDDAVAGVVREWLTEVFTAPAPDAPAADAPAAGMSLPDGLHPPNLFAHAGRAAEFEKSAYGLLGRMLEVVGRPRGASGVLEADIIRDVYDNGPDNLKSHAHKANRPLKAVGYPSRLTRREVRGVGVFISWEDADAPGSA